MGAQSHTSPDLSHKPHAVLQEFSSNPDVALHSVPWASTGPTAWDGAPVGQPTLGGNPHLAFGPGYPAQESTGQRFKFFLHLRPRPSTVPGSHDCEQVTV